MRLCNRSHFLRCPSRRNRTGPLFDELNEFWTENSFDPCLVTILREAMRLWLADTPIALPTVPAPYQALIIRQTLVGWDQLFFGRFVKDWISLQDKFVSANELNPVKFSGHRSICGSVKIIWQHVHNLWTRRNLDVHVRNAPTHEAASLDQARREIVDLYLLRSSVPSADRTFFYDSTATHFLHETTSTQLHTWLNTWRPVILHYAGLA